VREYDHWSIPGLEVGEFDSIRSHKVALEPVRGHIWVSTVVRSFEGDGDESR
jgi:hypothetical protein